MILAIVISFLIVLIVQQYFHYIERQKLLDRIQADSYHDFKHYEDKKETKEEEGSEKREWNFI